jgi:hypothetical protein
LCAGIMDGEVAAYLTQSCLFPDVIFNKDSRC